MKLHRIISTGLGTGYSPIAPGTAGSLIGAILFYGFNTALSSCDLSEWWIFFYNLLFIIVLYIVGLLAIQKTHKEWIHDDNRIVIDEIIGIGITILAKPLLWQIYVAAFVLFRVFDIWKPLFIKKLDNIKSNNGVILDDVLAGIYANLVLQILIYFKMLC